MLVLWMEVRWYRIIFLSIALFYTKGCWRTMIWLWKIIRKILLYFREK
jgi:hypothetical protein